MKKINKAHICKKCGRELQSTNKSGCCKHCEMESKKTNFAVFGVVVASLSLVVTNSKLRNGAVKLAKNTWNFVKNNFN